MDESAPRLGYRRGLDGLRAAAILLVMVGHSYPRLKGGGLGVDVFFALSGFLITTLVVEEFSARPDRYSFRNFYARRTLRLFPGLYALLAAVVVYVVIRWDALEGFMARSGGRRGDLWTYIAGAATYTTNLFRLEAGAGNLLGHTWSLAVEEQFYLVWPIVLIAMLRRRQATTLMAALSVFVLACLAARLAGIEQLTVVLWNRPDTIALGCVAALARWQFEGLRALVAKWSMVLIFGGGFFIAAVAAAVSTVVGTAMLDRGITSLIAVAATGVVWGLVESPPALAARLFEATPVVAIGLMSYSLYLWHQPVFRIVGWEMDGQSQVIVLVVKWVVSVAAAWLSLRLVETPARRMQERFRAAGRVGPVDQRVSLP